MVAMLAKKKNCAVALMIAAGASIIIMLSYCFFAGYYHSHIFKGTVVNGLDMSNMTAAQAKQVEREGGIYDRGDWVLLATPYLDEDREIRYKDIYLKTPEGREFGKFVPR